MVDAHSINTEHKDLIHDIAFDYYGERMATCSTDHHVKVFDQDDQGNWNLSAGWKAHSGSVWKVTWSNPEFGQVLATCSYDRTASIWEETVGEHNVGGTLLRKWVRRANLIDSRTCVTDVKFSPKWFGFFLATSSVDGIMRIYENPDIVNLSQWPLRHEVSLKIQNSCITWNPLVSIQRTPHALIAVGSDDNSITSSKVFLCEYTDVSRRWTKTESVSSITHPVHDMIFAPSMGRSYYLLGVATNNVRILKIKPLTDGTGGINTIETVAQFDDHLCTVWRLAWNITGTILASSGDDGFVRLWKSNLNGWKNVGLIKRNEKLPQPELKPAPSSTHRNLTRFFRLGQITHPSEVHRH